MCFNNIQQESDIAIVLSTKNVIFHKTDKLSTYIVNYSKGLPCLDGFSGSIMRTLKSCPSLFGVLVLVTLYVF